MKLFPFFSLIAATAITLPATPTNADDDYTFFVRQIQLNPTGELEWDMDVAQEGSEQSPLPINPFGARFELYTIKSSPLTSFLLDTTYVNSYIPVAMVEITSGDPYEVIPRTRADQPFEVSINISGLSTDPTAPAAAQSVKLLRHVQAYPNGEYGSGIDRGAATLLSQGSLNANGPHELDYTVTSIPGGDRTKVSGEERFSVFSLADYQSPESQLDSAFIQIWPVATSNIGGLDSSTVIKGQAPTVTLSLEDLYPDSYTYAQVYQGPQVLGTDGDTVPGSSLLVDGTIPRDEVLTIEDWDEVIREDGQWTIEVITVTPFGVERLEHVSFSVERTIRVNGAITSVE